MLEKLPEALGDALRDRRAGLEKILFNRSRISGGSEIELASPAFNDFAPIPRRFTADGGGISPPLRWSDSTTAASMVLIVEDPDAPTPRPLVHAIVVGLPAREGLLEEGALASSNHAGVGLTMGRNSYMQQRWIPPDPPPGHGVHCYAFQLFALAEGARFDDAPGRDEIEEKVRRFALASACLIGTYQRGG